MSILEQVARAIHQRTQEINGTGPAFPIPPFEHGTNFWGDMSRAAITAFLEAAATTPDKDGHTWRMVPDEATDRMVYKAEGMSDFVMPAGFENTHERRLSEMRSALAEAAEAAPPFKLDGETT